MSRKVLVIALLLSFVGLMSIVGVTQTATGEIHGRVLDQSGAVIPGASVTARDVNTGRERTATTNGEGFYSFQLLPPGQYEVTAEAANMRKQQSKLTLLIDQKLDANFNLKAASGDTTIDVSSEAPAIETTQSDLKTNIDQRQIADLPLNGRTFASLAILAPGVRPVGSFDPTKTRIGTVSINGSTGRNFNLSVDGGDNKDNVVGGFLQNYTTEGIQEFVVDTHKFGADTGKSAGGAVTIVTKSGTNALHGSAFIYERQKNLQATDFFTAHPKDSDAAGNPVPCPPCYIGPSNKKPPFDRQNYGGSLGGPIIKDKWFFFGAVEHVHENAAVAQAGATLDTLAGFKAAQATVTNPTIRNYPISLASSVPLPFRDTQWQVRSDFNLNARNSVFVRYAQQNNELSHDNLDGLEDPNTGSETRNILNSLLVNYTGTISNSAVNQFVFQWSKFFNSLSAEPISQGVPLISFPNGVGFGQNGLDPQTTEQTKWQYRDDLNWRKGNHNFKFGGAEVAVTKFGGRFAFTNTPNIILRADCSLATYGAAGCDRPLEATGAVRRFILASGTDTFFQPTVHQISYYFQDDWKIHPRLTLNLGIRNDIDLNLVPTDDQNPSGTGLSCAPGACKGNRGLRILQSLDPNALGAIIPGLSLKAPKNDLNNWAPRVGFAWDVMGTGNWVVRGGYGLFFDQLFQNVTLFAVQQANPNVYANAVDSGTMSSSNPNSPFSVAIAQAGTPTTTLPDLPYGARARFVDPRFQNPYAQHFTLGTQFALSKQWVASIDAVHVLSLHEFAQTEINPASDGSNGSRLLNVLLDPTYGCANSSFVVGACGTPGFTRHRLHRITRAESTNRSRFDSLTFEVKRQFANHYQVGASYILSKARTYGGFSADFGSISQGINPADTAPVTRGGTTVFPTQLSALRGIIQPQNWGYASEDERHRFVFNGLVELPWGINLSGILQASSARPYTMFADDDINGDGTFTDLYSPHVTGDPNFDPIGEGDVRFATSNNSLRGKPYYQVDMRAGKTFKITERVRLDVMADMFNLFNHTNFGNAFQTASDGFGPQQPDVPVLTGADGPAVKQLPRKPIALFGGGFGGAGTVGIPFQAQFGVKIHF